MKLLLLVGFAAAMKLPKLPKGNPAPPGGDPNAGAGGGKKSMLGGIMGKLKGAAAGGGSSGDMVGPGMYGQAPYGQPMYGQQGYGQNGQPMQVQPTNGQQMYGQPSFGGSQFGFQQQQQQFPSIAMPADAFYQATRVNDDYDDGDYDDDDDDDGGVEFKRGKVRMTIAANDPNGSICFVPRRVWNPSGGKGLHAGGGGGKLKQLKRKLKKRKKKVKALKRQMQMMERAFNGMDREDDEYLRYPDFNLDTSDDDADDGVYFRPRWSKLRRRQRRRVYRQQPMFIESSGASQRPVFVGVQDPTQGNRHLYELRYV